MLQINNLTFGYNQYPIINSFSIELSEGDVILINGCNGCGKSTLFQCIYNLLPLKSGEIVFQGKNINNLPPSELIKLGIVYMPQKDYLFENLTVEENLRIAGNIYPKIDLNDRICEVFEALNLKSFADFLPSYLSGGQKKLLGFSMGILHKPKLILIDEPFAGIDDEHKEIISEYLRKKQELEKIAMIIIEHHQCNHFDFTRSLKMDSNGNIH